MEIKRIVQISTFRDWSNVLSRRRLLAKMIVFCTFLTTLLLCFILFEKTQLMFSESSFTGSRLTKPSFTESRLTKPSFTELRFTKPSLTEPKLTESKFTEPKLTEPKLTEPMFIEPKLTEPMFTEPKLTEQKFTQPKLTQPMFIESKFTDPKFTDPNLKLDIPVSEHELNKYPPLDGLASFESFPSSGDVQIPRIIHQTWKTRQIPRQLMKWIQSWQRYNPDYEYWLWTDDSARSLIAERHPHLLSMYDNYDEAIERADALRYVILYEFGGIYADTDVESLKSLDPFFRKYACFVPLEPPEHPLFNRNVERLLSNAVIGCRAKHPFFKFLIDNLRKFSHLRVGDSTGPYFVSKMYHEYIEALAQEESNCICNKKGVRLLLHQGLDIRLESNRSKTDQNHVYISPAEYFNPTIDQAPDVWSRFRTKCLNFNKLSKLQQRACVGLKFRNPKRKPLNVSFTDHHWAHIHASYGDRPFRKTLKQTVDIKDIVPGVKIYSG